MAGRDPQLHAQLGEQGAAPCREIVELVAELALDAVALVPEERGEQAETDRYQAHADQGARGAPRALLVLLVYLTVAVRVVSLVVAAVFERLFDRLRAAPRAGGARQEQRGGDPRHDLADHQAG